MAYLVSGLLILAAWAAITFGIHPDSGWIHIGLIVGVILVIRGIVARDEAASS